MTKLLVVDDDKNIRRILSTFLESAGHSVQQAADAASALAALSKEPDIALVLTDFRMAEMNGLELLERIKQQHPDTLVIIMTAYATVESAVAIIKAGAYDYLTKPFSLDRVRQAVERALEVGNLRVENRALRDVVHDLPLTDSRSSMMQAVLRTARQAANSDATIILLGESGAGKNVLARQIHEWSPRHERPFVVVNCTTLSDQLLESELFGHVRGAFTGAIKNKPGRLEAAAGGTVFLDEIADLSPTLQTKLLRFLQERQFERVGGDETIEIDARIIAASNRDLEREVAAGHFREDLFYRLNVISLRVPVLRERPEDIRPLVEHFLTAAALRNRRPGLRLSPEAMEALCAYQWPGNIRELRNAIERAVVLSRSDVIPREGLPDRVFQAPRLLRPPPPSGGTLEELERDHIRRVLAEAVTLEEAAETLGISTTTLWRKRKRYSSE
ncbi:MAG TPA: sigma-54 dependent transcriptional regulator [Myxococcota bacterium]|nr:sigma-54 dependent transcriptional regulator [Myxococcota bacterium]